MKSIKIDGLAKAVEQALGEYSEYVTAEVKEVIRETGKKAAKELKKTSPRDSGDYAKSWKSDTVRETANTIHISVHASDGHYRLTHLLENGHAKRGGGRVAAIPHIAPVNEEALEFVEREIEKNL